MLKKLSSITNNPKLFNLSLLIIVLIFLFTIFSSNLKNFGDGSEYTLMLESFYINHTPALTNDAINSAYTNSIKYDYESKLFTNENAYSGYFLGNDNNYYSYHFFGISLLALPIRTILGILDLNPFYSFAIFNLILFVISSLILFKIINKNKLISYLILILNTSLLYLTLNHSEYFSLIFVLLSSVLFLKNKYFLSILFASIASIQNTPILFLLIFLNIYVLVKNFKEYKLTNKFFRQLVLNGLVSLIGIIPFIFYYIYFNTFNLIQKVGGSDLSLISLKKFIEMFIDPNLGVLFFSPLPILGLILGILLILKKHYKILILYISLTLMCLLSTSTTNWNAGMITSTRYAIWSIIPIGSVVLIEVLNRIDDLKILVNKNILKLIIYLLLIYQLSIVILSGGIIWNSRFGASGFTPFAQIILNNLPSIYSPTNQIFEGRVLCNEKLCDYPIIYKYNNECKKVLLENNENNISKVISECGNIYNIDYCNSTFCYYSY